MTHQLEAVLDFDQVNDADSDTLIGLARDFHFEEGAAELGIRTLHLEVEVRNDNATRLYRIAGFRETGRRLMRLRVWS